jgi:NADH:ubiquinone oxidoreductase subunit
MRAFEMDAHYDASQVTPEWHGWLHYVSDKPGGVMKNEFSQPWVTVHTQNPSIDRSTHYVPPGHWKNTLPRGRIGPKYESWTPAGSDEPVPALRNYSDNTHTLRVSE